MRRLSNTELSLSETMSRQGSVEELCQFMRRHPGLFVITGAGISDASGIPTYRDDTGVWKGNTPIQHGEFLADADKRRRYWARSFRGWPTVGNASPNLAHRALATLEAKGYVKTVVTQNIDRLHQKAGHRRVIDLHGRLDEVLCTDCGASKSRAAMQQELQQLNPRFEELQQQLLVLAPDGDADVSQEMVDQMLYPDCRQCGGLLMPNVVFYGGTVAKEKVQEIYQRLQEASAVLVVGSSLMVYSSFRFCKFASEQGMALACINKGLTRADSLYQLKLHQDCAQVLQSAAATLPSLLD